MTEHPPHDDDQLRALLHDAVSDVEPQHALDTIRTRSHTRSRTRTRTKGTPMSTRSPWLVAAGAAVLATAATIAVVNLAGDDAPGPTAGPPAPAVSGPSTLEDKGGSPSPKPVMPSPSEPPAQPEAATVPVYYVGETSRGPRLFREFHRVTTADPLSAALSEAVGTDTESQAVKPDDPDYRTDWPAMTTASGRSEGDVITVSLGGDSEPSLRDRPAGMTEEQARLAVQQLVYTAQAATQSTAPVRFEVYGEPSDTVLGVPTNQPLARASADSVLAQVWVIDPTQGATVDSGFKVTGLAAAFEANVQWELMQGDKVVRRGFTTAKECCTMAPYAFTVKAPPGAYTLVVHDEDASGAGNPTWQDTKDVTVR